jgi:hypothetical protein
MMHHAEAEQLAAFVDGRLEREEIDAVASRRARSVEVSSEKRWRSGTKSERR